MTQQPVPDSDPPVEPPRSSEAESPLFKLVIVTSAAFLITVLSMVVAMLGPGESPLAGFINRNGVRMIGVEVVLILVFGVLAMAADRRRTMLNGNQQTDRPGSDLPDSKPPSTASRQPAPGQHESRDTGAGHSGNA